MAELGKMNDLEVLRKVTIGYYLDGENLGEILLPNNEADKGIKVGDKTTVFIYKDSEDRIIATSQRPFACVGEFANLEVIAKDTVGAFLDWGLKKNLLLPYSEQKLMIEVGKKYLVYLYVDNSDRIAATTKINKFLKGPAPDFKVGDEVSIIIAKKTDLGWSAIINNLCTGLLYENEVYVKLSTGEKNTAYIKRIRDDGKIDLSLNKIGYDNIEDASEIILNLIKQKNGKLFITDKSSPEEIKNLLGLSKKAFKKAVGKLYKEKKIILSDKFIELNSKIEK
ncbi:MAG: GntR family transcriptional regulator [Spirochaetales bacterium]|nr:GntR family transcriptional regulator [Spirochaetales bacterium]